MSLFITFEGPEGSGKTTQINRLAEHLRAQSHTVLLTREPGGTTIGDQVRKVLHDRANTDMHAVAEILLYSASRAQLTHQVIKPALARGSIVLSDRYFDSTFAYQGYGRGLNLDMLRQITGFATGGLTPDFTIYLDIPAEEGLRRRKQDAGGEWNRLDDEALEFHKRVVDGYYQLMKEDPARWFSVDATRPVDEVAADIARAVDKRVAGI